MAEDWLDEYEKLDEDTQGDQTKQEKARKEYMLFLIDARVNAADGNSSEGCSFLEDIAGVLREFLGNQVVGGENPYVAFAFFGSAMSRNPNDVEDVFVWKEFDVVGSDLLVELAEHGANLTSVCGGGKKGPFPLGKAFWAAATLFSETRTKDARKRLVVITNDDNPCGEDRSFRDQTIAKAHDLAGSGVEMCLLYDNRAGCFFDTSKLFGDVLPLSGETTSLIPYDPSREKGNRALILSRSLKKRRVYAKIPFIIPRESKQFSVDIGVKVYALCSQQEAKKPSPTYMDVERQKHLKTETKYFCENTGAPLMRSQIKRGLEYGGTTVVFDAEEVNSFAEVAASPATLASERPALSADEENSDGGSLVLLGFRSAIGFKHHLNIRPAHFVVDDEENVPGSRKALAAIYEGCNTEGLSLMCYVHDDVQLRRNALPRLGALFPRKQDPSLDIPCGFALRYIPFADDIRHVAVEGSSCGEISDDSPMRQSFRNFIRNVRVQYSPEHYNNPALLRFQMVLKAIACQEPIPEEIVDNTKPKWNMILEQSGRAARDLAEAFAGMKEGKQKKRKTEQESSQVSKRARADVDASMKKWTVAALKEFCKTHGLSTQGKKADLLERVENFQREER